MSVLGGLAVLALSACTGQRAVQPNAELPAQYDQGAAAAASPPAPVVGSTGEAEPAAEDANVSESTRAFEGWNARFHAGAVPYVAVLEAQRTLIAAREQHAHYRLARLQALVNLDKALGGAWSSTPAAMAAAR